MAKILLLEQDEKLAAVLVKWLRREYYMVEVLRNGYDGFKRLRRHAYDLVILDWNLEEISGLDICRHFRQHDGLTPILMLTDRGSDYEKAIALDAGADDYITKPFSLVELSAHLRALLRRAQIERANILTVGEIVMDIRRRAVTRDGITIHLVPGEFRLLEVFMRRAGEIATVDELRQMVWHSQDITANGVRTCVNRLRQKLDAHCQTSAIETVHSMGYRFRASEK